jgi:hypothetical protein
MPNHQGSTVEAVERLRGNGTSLICRLEGGLRGGAEPVIGPTSSDFVHDLEADVVGGPLSGRHLTGLNRLTLRADGVGLFAGPGTIECEGGSISLDIRAFVVCPSDLGWPRPDEVRARHYEFPDHDFRVTGSAIVRSDLPTHAHLDGSAASIEGWVNLESGELQFEAWSM